MFNTYSIWVSDDKKVLEMETGDSCTAVRLYLTATELYTQIGWNKFYVYFSTVKKYPLKWETETEYISLGITAV